MRRGRSVCTVRPQSDCDECVTRHVTLRLSDRGPVLVPRTGPCHGESKITDRGCVVVVSLGAADHVHGRGGAWPHTNKKKGILRIDRGYFEAEVRGEESGTEAQPQELILKPTRQNPPL